MQHSGTVKSQIDMKTARKATIVNAPPGAWPAARRFAKGHLLLSQRPSFTRQKTVFCKALGINTLRRRHSTARPRACKQRTKRGGKVAERSSI